MAGQHAGNVTGDRKIEIKKVGKRKLPLIRATIHFTITLMVTIV